MALASCQHFGAYNSEVDPDSFGKFIDT